MRSKRKRRRFARRRRFVFVRAISLRCCCCSSCLRLPSHLHPNRNYRPAAAPRSPVRASGGALRVPCSSDCCPGHAGNASLQPDNSSCSRKSGARCDWSLRNGKPTASAAAGRRLKPGSVAAARRHPDLARALNVHAVAALADRSAALLEIRRSKSCGPTEISTTVPRTPMVIVGVRIDIGLMRAVAADEAERPAHRVDRDLLRRVVRIEHEGVDLEPASSARSRCACCR